VDAADFVVKGLNCGVDSVNVRVEIAKGYIVCESGTSFCDVLLSMYSQIKEQNGHFGTVSGEDRGKERLRIFECEGGARQKGLQECPMARVVVAVFSHIVRKGWVAEGWWLQCDMFGGTRPKRA
jgi:hypothetical protein